MSNGSPAKRILALDLRPRSFGFVVCEGPDRLLDCGVKVFRRGAARISSPARERLSALLRQYEPSLLLLKASVSRQRSTMRQLDRMRDALHRDTSPRVRIRPVSSQRMRRFFAERARNKDDRAAMIAERFPDLAWKLPPRRRLPRREHYRMSIFDAAALALAYYGPASEQASS